jgi:hypothetical protein
MPANIVPAWRNSHEKDYAAVGDVADPGGSDNIRHR